jgi:hypothetical protein
MPSPIPPYPFRAWRASSFMFSEFMLGRTERLRLP